MYFIKAIFKRKKCVDIKNNIHIYLKFNTYAWIKNKQLCQINSEGEWQANCVCVCVKSFKKKTIFRFETTFSSVYAFDRFRDLLHRLSARWKLLSARLSGTANFFFFFYVFQRPGASSALRQSSANAKFVSRDDSRLRLCSFTREIYAPFFVPQLWRGASDDGYAANRLDV